MRKYVILILFIFGITAVYLALPREWNTSVQEDFGELWSKNHRQNERRLSKLVPQIRALKVEGKKISCLEQRFSEVEWLIDFTDRQEEVKKQLFELETDVAKGNPSNADTQLPEDGSFGKCVNPWFLRLHYSVAPLTTSQRRPEFALRFLDTVNSPEKLSVELEKLLVSDVKKEGIDHRKELELVVPGLLKLSKAASPFYSFHPQFKNELIKFVHQWQNPETGMWGAWYRRKDQLYKTDDLRITRLLAEELEGNISSKGKMVETIYKNRELPYPFGLLIQRKFAGESSLDATKLFRLGWASTPVSTQEKVRAELKRMIAAAVKTLSHETDPYSILFLEEAGYFRKENRFWTSEDFPDAAALKVSLIQRIEALPNSDPLLNRALLKLKA